MTGERVLLDTSVVIDLARGVLKGLPGNPSHRVISVITLAGLHHGVLASKPEQLASRLRTLDLARAHFTVMPVDEMVAFAYGQIAADTRRILGRRLKLGDGLIAATALAHDLTMLSRDEDFRGIPSLDIAII